MIPTPLDKQLTGQPRVAISQVSWQPGSHKIYRYVGSFPLSVDVLARKTSSMGSNLPVLRAGYDHGKNVLLEISLQAITISSTECHQVIMSHPLKRISYGTCDLVSCLFSLMLWFTSSPPHIQQCHIFRLRTPCQRGAKHYCRDNFQGCLCHAVLVVAGGLTRRLSGLQDQLKIFSTMQRRAQTESQPGGPSFLPAIHHTTRLDKIEGSL